MSIKFGEIANFQQATATSNPYLRYGLKNKQSMAVLGAFLTANLMATRTLVINAKEMTTTVRLLDLLCPKCDAIFTSRRVVEQHLTKTHGLDSCEIEKCENSGCNATVSSAVDMMRHKKVCSYSDKKLLCPNEWCADPERNFENDKIL